MPAIYSYQRDHFVETSDLTLPYQDDISGTLRGYRIFTACRTVHGKVFRLQDHLDRLYNSAAAIYMEPPIEREGLARLLEKIVGKNLEIANGSDLLIDIIFSGGLEGTSMKQSGKGAHLYVAVQELVPPTPEQYANGVHLATFRHQRMCPEVKLLNYIGAIVAHQTVVPKQGAFEVLFTSLPDGKHILEGSTFTVFFINGADEILTPPLDGRILDSITRKVLLQILRNNDEFQVRETDIPTDSLSSMSEAFMVSTTRNVLPVVRIDDTLIGDGKPGSITNRVLELLEEYIKKY